MNLVQYTQTESSCIIILVVHWITVETIVYWGQNTLPTVVDWSSMDSVVMSGVEQLKSGHQRLRMEYIGNVWCAQSKE